MRFEICPSSQPIDHLEHLTMQVASALTGIAICGNELTGESQTDETGVLVDHEALMLILDMFEFVGRLDEVNLTPAVARVASVLRVAADEIDRRRAVAGGDDSGA